MDRGVITYTIAYIAGILSAALLPVNPIISIILTPALIFISHQTKRRTIKFLITTHLAVLLLGNTSEGLGLKEIIPDKFSHTYNSITENIKESLTKRFATYITTDEELSVITALTLGEKRDMDKSLKRAYSSAGAMHILALSGLHIGIIFLIITKLLFPISLLPRGKTLVKIISVIVIFLYAIITGCSPSVLRASLMIFLYKIAQISYRDIDKWSCIALAALVICIISPTDIYSAGFQLSFAAVIGIGLFYPSCKDAWNWLSNYIKNSAAKRGLKFIWETLSISICCQITTLPIVLYYFGFASQFYLITNIAAIPIATGILYLVVPTLFFSDLPMIGEGFSYLLNALVYCLNLWVKFISV